MSERRLRLKRPSPPRPTDHPALAPLMARLGHQFATPALLHQALIHRSAQTVVRLQSYERLEFLGDRVLGVLVAELLYRRFPDEAEGALARRHTALVRKEALARVARKLHLGDSLILSHGEEDAGGRDSDTILSDVCEAIIGALYLDGGLETARSLITAYWPEMMDEAFTPPKDAKTTLQEWAQQRGLPLPTYRTVASDGPDHSPNFVVEVAVQGYPAAQANGSSKRNAAQAAAQVLLQRLL